MTDWKPRRRGAIYCSPSCGGKCTWKAFKAAHASADKLVKHLGRGWTSRVWENMGWHFEVLFGNFRLHEYVTVNRKGGKTRSYMAFWNNDSNFRGDGLTPEQALAIATAKMRRQIAILSDALDEVRDEAIIITISKR